MIATSGRPTLTTTLNAVTPQLEPGDEILVLRDNTDDHGNTPRNNAIPRCAGTHLMFIDDDDRYLKDALEYVREQVSDQPNRVHVFAMVYDNGRTIHPTWPFQIGYIGTPMFIVPNVPGNIGRWTYRYEGDYDFIDDTMTIRGDTPILHDDVIATVTT